MTSFIFMHNKIRPKFENRMKLGPMDQGASPTLSGGHFLINLVIFPIPFLTSVYNIYTVYCVTSIVLVFLRYTFMKHPNSPTPTYRLTETHPYSHTHRPTHTDRHTPRQTHTDRHTHTDTATHTHSEPHSATQAHREALILSGSKIDLVRI